MNKKFVVQANKLIEAHYYLSTGEQKLIHLMASMIRKNHNDFHSYEFTIKDLAKILDIVLRAPEELWMRPVTPAFPAGPRR